MFTDLFGQIITGIITINQILSAGIAITAFSLLLYSLSFNLRDHVARAFAIILLCVVVIFTSEALESSSSSDVSIALFLRLEWFGIVFLPATYLQLSSALMEKSGIKFDKSRQWMGYLGFLIGVGCLILLVSGNLLGQLVKNGQPAPHLQRTIWTEVFTIYYFTIMVLAWINFGKAYKHILTRSGRRRMIYLLTGATAPAIGSFPYLLYGSSLAGDHPLIFWGLALLTNVLFGILLVVMAYAVAFFGVSWPDRVVKSKLFKWLMRGPVTASVTLGVMTIVRRVGEYFGGVVYSGAVPVFTVATVLMMEHIITLVAPLWDRLIFFGQDRDNLSLLQNLEDRLITQNDLRQFLEGVLAAMRDHLQSETAFVAALDDEDLSILVNTGNASIQDGNLDDALHQMNQGNGTNEYSWNKYWIFPLQQSDDAGEEQPVLLGLLGVTKNGDQEISPDQRQALQPLVSRAVLALKDRKLQQHVFRSLENLNPQVDMFQRIRAVSHYDSKTTLIQEVLPPESDLATWVKDALTHYWGGPKLTQSPLLQLQLVQQSTRDNGDNAANTLRSILRQAVDSIRPSGERKYTGEWILFNILEMKFIEGRKVRDVATRLAMSEADLYRKQRVAIEEVGRALLEMERTLQSHKNQVEN
jgi:hypothetical protein